MPSIDQARTWYDERDPVHGFDHVLRVLRLAEDLGRQLGADLEVLQAAALLHDARGAHPGEGRDGAPHAIGEGRLAHQESSAGFARDVLQAEGWAPKRIEAVVECIRSHRFRGQARPKSLEAQILFDADKLDVMGAFGAARTIGYAIQSGQPVYAEPSPRFLDEGEGEPGEVHSAYHEYLFKLRHVRERLFTEPARRLGERRHHALTAFFDQMAAEARGEG